MNEKIIWDFIYYKVKNAYGTAALMGNLMAESSLKPTCVNGVKDPKKYIADADAGNIDFVHDRKAFGLAQWCYWARKKGLLNYAKKQNASISNLTIQLEYMWIELQTYKTVLNAITKATNIREASDIIMARYEKPANTTEAAKQKRADYGQKFYDEFTKPDVVKVVATDAVRIRAGDGLTYPVIGKMKKDESLEWVVDSNGFHGVRLEDRVGWVSGEFSKVI